MEFVNSVKNTIADNEKLLGKLVDGSYLLLHVGTVWTISRFSCRRSFSVVSPRAKAKGKENKFFFSLQFAMVATRVSKVASWLLILSLILAVVCT
jgi:hypothetical protein